MADLSRKIRELRRILRLDQAAFGKLLDVSQGTVSKWESGSDFPRFENISRLSQLAGEPIDAFWNEEEHQFRRPEWPGTTRVIGAVQAGKWIESIEWDQLEQFAILVPLPNNWPELETVGFEVRGSSMNLLYPEGSIVVVVPTISSGIHPRHGDRVIVQRQDERGLFEVTLKEYAIDAQGNAWLWPRSDDPDHWNPIRPEGEAETGDEILITGIVVASFRVENPGRFA